MNLVKPFLKWPGGKYRVLDRIHNHLASDMNAPGKRLIEPFVGSGAVFLNTSYKRYLLADSNPDLIMLYQLLQQRGEAFIEACRRYFIAGNNCAARYYRLRERFNKTNDPKLKSILFVYLNRHCYNGLCRYNASHEFNTPFGRYKRPYFPGKEMLAFYYASKKATFIQLGFVETMKKARRGDVVYCDPPYAPLSRTACFTDYFVGGFGWEQQTELSDCASRLAQKGIQVIISNHHTRHTASLYRNAGASTERFMVSRTISCKPSQRNQVEELLAVFQ